jgi:hypothetical protein
MVPTLPDDMAIPVPSIMRILRNITVSIWPYFIAIKIPGIAITNRIKKAILKGNNNISLKDVFENNIGSFNI